MWKKGTAIFTLSAAIVFIMAGSPDVQARDGVNFIGFKGLQVSHAIEKIERKIASAFTKQDMAPPTVLSSRMSYSQYEASMASASYDHAVGVQQDEEIVSWKKDEGLNVRMSDDLALTGGYQFRSGDRDDFGGYNVDYEGHELVLGVKINLP